ncbi:MAG: hypothetical protein M0R66_08145 [Candidatus Omnitrophica bacterium]|nr:hypothetical protein [Candidatus Omnitrophota bacterium]
MSKKRVIIVIFIFIIFGFKAIKDARPISKSIDISGDYVTIRYGNTFIKAKMKPEAKEDFLVNNGFEGKKSDGWFFVIPMEQAKAMKATYGDFVHCNSPGASAGKESLQMLMLFTAEQQTREKIKKVIKRSLNSPIVEIRGSKLEIEEHFVGTTKYSQFDPNMPENYYLIKDISITQEYYQ